MSAAGGDGSDQGDGDGSRADDPAQSGAGAGAARANLVGAAWMSVSAASATVMLVAVRMLTDQSSPEMLAFLRTALGLWIVVWFWADGRLFRFRFKRLDLHVARGAAAGFALTLAFIGTEALPLATITILLFLAPVFATALSGPVLGERVGWRRWLAVGAGFVGAAIIVRPGLEPVGWGVAAGLSAALLFSLTLLLTKPIGRDHSADAILVSSTVVSALVTAPFAIATWSPPSGVAAWAWVAALVMASSLRMYADIKAYSAGEAGFIAPFAYLRLVFAAALGWALFAETIDGWTLLGAAVIFGATFAIAVRERRLLGEARSARGGGVAE